MKIPAGISIFVYNGYPQAVVGGIFPLRSIWKANRSNTGFIGYNRGMSYPGISGLHRDTFYLIDAIEPFDLPDAQNEVCPVGSLPATGRIPLGVSMFAYAGPPVDIASAPWAASLMGVYRATDNNSGMVGYVAGDSFPGFTQLETGKFYLIETSAAIGIDGAQVIACPEWFGRETNPLDMSPYSRYDDIDNELPVGPPDPNRYPGMPLFMRYLGSGGGPGVIEARVQLGTTKRYFEQGTVQNITVSGSYIANGKTLNKRQVLRNNVLWQEPLGDTISYPDTIRARTLYKATVEADGISIEAETTSEPVYPWFYWSSDVAATSGTEIYLASKVIEPAGEELTVASFGTGIKYLKFAVPFEAQAYTRWKRSNIDTGNIGSSSDLFGPMQIISVTSQGLDSNWTKQYQVYVSNYQTEASETTIIT